MARLFRPSRSAWMLGVLVVGFGCVAGGCSSASDGGTADDATGLDNDAGAVDEVGGNTSKDGGADARRAVDAPSHDASPADGCVPKPGADEPDDDFIDSNCDGIDGDATHAIFVAPTGADGAPGTMDAPLKSIGEAVTKAAKDKKEVYVCNATYAEALRLDGVAVSVFGGYDCKDGWRRIADRAVLAPGSGVALSIQHVIDPVVVDRIDARAVDATDAGGTSMAAIVTDSAKVTIKNDVFTAGMGGHGKDGDPGATYSPDRAVDGAAGETLTRVDCNRYMSPLPADCARGGAGGVTDLPDSCMNPGGIGGTGGYKVFTKQTAGSQGWPTGLGGAVSGIALDGLPGKDGSIGSPGMPAKSGFGAIVGDTYVATNAGSAGTDGTSGGGGSGGSGGETGSIGGDTSPNYFDGGGGGEGGWGGCGGHAGNGAGGGGASIALLLRDSSVTIAHTTLNTASGGGGGNAGRGGVGQLGGLPGRGGVGTAGTSYWGTGNFGGKGGKGGDGGPGGAGGGGPSIGLLVVHGDAPSSSDLTVNVGAGGKGGHGLLSGDGADGEVHETWNLTAPVGGGSDAGTGG